MKKDQEKTKDELLKELKDLKARFEERTLALEQECLDRDQTEEALRMAKVIIDYSPAILFRRLADMDDPRLVYGSPRRSRRRSGAATAGPRRLDEHRCQVVAHRSAGPLHKY